MQHRFAGEAGHFYILVGSNNDAAGPADFIRSQHILRTLGAVGLHTDIDAHFQCFFLKGILCHKGVGNPGRASRNSYNET
ncbi:hypothetical protein D3C72_2066730 [compost metagenome]